MKQMIGLLFFATFLLANPSYGSGCGGSNWVVVREIPQGTVPLEIDAFGGAKAKMRQSWGLTYWYSYWNVAVEGSEAEFRSEAVSAHDISPLSIENALLALPKETRVEKVLQTLRVDYDDCDEDNVGKERSRYIYKFSIVAEDQNVQFTTSYY